MLKVLAHATQGWLPMFWADFRRRFVNLLGFEFKKFSPAMALGVITNKLKSDSNTTPMPADQLQLLISPYDLKRLEQYSSNMADYHLIMDLLPNLAKIYFLYDVENLKKPHLGAIQQAILTGIGLQCKTVDTLSAELDIPASQLLGLLNTMLRKYTAALKGSQEAVIAKAIKATSEKSKTSGDKIAPLASSMNDELEEAAKDLKAKQQKELDKMKVGMDLSQYKIKGDDKEWDEALQGQSGKSAKKTLSVKTGEKRLADELKNGENEENGQQQQPSKKKKKKNKAKKSAS